MTDQFLSLSYWKTTKNIYYSMLFILPMLFLYEMMCWVQFHESFQQIRNGADVLLRQLFFSFDNFSESLYGGILIVIFLIMLFANRFAIENGRLNISFLLFMFLESLIWSTVFLIIMGLSEKILLSIANRNLIPEEFYLAIGAGIWEELLFRVGVIALITFLIKDCLGYTHFFAIICAILISSIIFSIFHYLGQFGDIFTYKVFIYRSIAGIFLGILYKARGFGIVVYTHIFYDMAIISLPVLLS
tara:strand:+ start:62 stop:796 length:735 start_codon:yes stop_codon:yes gene_type:complete